MKKIVLSALALSSLVYSAQLGIDAGWSMVGFSESISPKNVFNNSSVNSVWRYNTADEKWEFFSPNTQLQALATSLGYNAIPENLNNYAGIWVQALSPIVVETDAVPINSVFTPNYTQKYDNNYFGTQNAMGKFSFGTSSDGINWSELYTKQAQSAYGYSQNMFLHSDTRADIVFETYDYNGTASIQSVYGLIYDSGIVTEALLDRKANGYAHLVNGMLFAKNDNNATSIALVEGYDYATGSSKTLKIFESAADSWDLKKTISDYSGYIQNINYYGVSQYNTSHQSIGYKYVLNSFSTFDILSNKTNFYGTANDYSLLFSLVGLWNNMYSTSGVDGFSILASQNGYNESGKSIAIVQNSDNSHVEKQFDHRVRTIGTIYHYDQNTSLQTQDFYVFTHDDLGGDLSIYNSTDKGVTFSLFETSPSFHYAINHVNSLSYNAATGLIECTLTVNDYTMQIKSTDSFATWTPVTNARPNTAESSENPEDKNWIKVQNQDGSFTLTRKQ